MPLSDLYSGDLETLAMTESEHRAPRRWGRSGAGQADSSSSPALLSQGEQPLGSGSSFLGPRGGLWRQKQVDL